MPKQSYPVRDPAASDGASDLEADVDTVLAHIAQRWEIEVLFADVKELLGIDPYQLMSAQAIRRFWVLVMVAYDFLDRSALVSGLSKAGM